MILVIGNGPAAARFTQALRQHGHRGEVTGVGRGPDPAPREGGHRLPDHPSGVRVLTRTAALRVDRALRRVRTRGPAGEPGWLGYDALVLATGARPRVPRVAGLRTPQGGLADGVVTTVHAAGENTEAGERVLVLGAGRRGAEAALALRHAGREVIVVDPGPYPMRRHLDAEAGALLAGHLADRDIALHAGCRVVEYVPGKVTLDDLPLLYERYLEGVIAAPKYLPPMFRDLNGLYVWFGFSSGMSLMNIARVQQHFNKLFQQMPATAPLYAGKANADAELD
jgi:assimilatory nitrate reductase electron transfer subunit